VNFLKAPTLESAINEYYAMCAKFADASVEYSSSPTTPSPTTPVESSANSLEIAFDKVNGYEVLRDTCNYYIELCEKTREVLVNTNTAISNACKNSIDDLLKLVTEYNTKYPGAIDTTLSHELIFDEYRLHKYTLEFSERVKKSRESSSTPSSSTVPTDSTASTDSTNPTVSSGSTSSD
jgi:hypothetical protein